MRIESELANTEDWDKNSQSSKKPKQSPKVSGGIEYPSSSYSSSDRDSQVSQSEKSGQHYMNKSMPTKRAYLPQVKRMQ